MAASVSSTKISLSCPLYSLDFDPYNRGYLVVGGGGGASRTGVDNKLILLDISSRSTINVVTDIDLSHDEDSVMSLANLATRDGLISLAGINSSDVDRKTGRNEHLRAFNIRYPKRKRRGTTADREDASENTKDKAVSSQISLLGKSSIFTAKTGPDSFQRLLKLSPARRVATGSKRIGVMATGMAKYPQIVMFDVTKSPVEQAQIIRTNEVEEEASDLDIIDTGASDFSICWCSDYAVHEQSVNYNFETSDKILTPNNFRRIYNLERIEDRIRPKFRCLRFLTDHHILLLANSPNRSGAELAILHMYPTGPATIVSRKRLPSRIKQAAAMDVCVLDADGLGSRQFAVAIAGQDQSIEILTLDYVRQTDSMVNFKRYKTLWDIHSNVITGLRFAPFYSPESTQPGEQYIRLASVSVGRTVVVNTFTIRPLDHAKPSSRYVLSRPAKRWMQLSSAAIWSLLVLIFAMLAQSYFYPESTRAISSQLTAPLRSIFYSHPQMTTIQSTQRLRDLLPGTTSPSSSSHKAKAIIIRDLPNAAQNQAGLDVQVVHDGGKSFMHHDANAKRWEDMPRHERAMWKDKLVEAGIWTVDEGEAVLKGVVFGTWARAVGAAVGDALGP